MTKLSLYASAAALAMLATVWSVQASAAGPTPFYTPVNPSDPVTSHPYDIKPGTASKSGATPFYTPVPPAAMGTSANSSSVAEAPHLRTDTMDPNHEPINP